MVQIAVIVPVYNVEKYLQRCVDSIIAQTYPNLRLILVDDGSLDGCPAICDAYASKDSRVHVIHQQNSGPSRARNAGIDWALGHTDCSYLSFVDSDDCIHPSYFHRLISAIQATGAGAAMCMHQYINQYENLTHFPQNLTVQPKAIQAEELMVRCSDSFNYPWGKLFSRASFQDLRYPEDVSFGEDNLVIYRALFACETVAFVEEKLYYYFYNAEGITKSPWNERSLQVFLGIEAQLEYYKANGYEKAFQKETELHIQQCAYQIHRIREERSVQKANCYHLEALKKRMRRILRESRDFQLTDRIYWYEALHPVSAGVYTLARRVRRNLEESTLKEILGKLIASVRKK